jgi:hypothetical protein
LPIGSVIGNDLVRRHEHPFAVDRCIPTIFGIPSLAKFDLERSLNVVAGVATGLRIFVPVGILVIVRTLQVLKKFLIRSVWPLAFARIVGIWVVWPTVVRNDVLEFVRIGKGGRRV